MNFNPCLKHKMVRKAVRQFAETELHPIAYEIDRDARFPEEVIEKMRPLNYFGLQAPKAYGGGGNGQHQQCHHDRRVVQGMCRGGIMCSRT